MINDRLLVQAIKLGEALADECARVNWRKLEEHDEKVAEGGCRAVRRDARQSQG